METADFNKNSLDGQSNILVSIILKIEIILAVLFLSDETMAKAVSLGAVCVLINQFTEAHYLKKSTMRPKLLVLCKSLLVTLFFYLAAYSIGVNFYLYRHGGREIDTYKIWLIAKLLMVVFILLSAMRLLAVGGDCLINRLEKKRKLKNH